jgi:hypothetical protein
VSVDQFIGIIPGAIDDLGDEHDLSWGARSLLLWLVTSACDRETGTAHHISINAIVDTTRLSWRAAKRSLDELETAGAASSDLPRGHEGTIEISHEWHRQIVWAAKKGERTRGTSVPPPQGKRARGRFVTADARERTGEMRRSRGSTGRSRGSTGRSRGSTDGSRGSTVANRENADKRERRPERVFDPLGGRASSGAQGGASSGAPLTVDDANALAERIYAALQQGIDASMSYQLRHVLSVEETTGRTVVHMPALTMPSNAAEANRVMDEYERNARTLKPSGGTDEPQPPAAAASAPTITADMLARSHFGVRRALDAACRIAADTGRPEPSSLEEVAADVELARLVSEANA